MSPFLTDSLDRRNASEEGRMIGRITRSHNTHGLTAREMDKVDEHMVSFLGASDGVAEATSLSAEHAEHATEEGDEATTAFFALVTMSHCESFLTNDYSSTGV